MKEHIPLRDVSIRPSFAFLRPFLEREEFADLTAEVFAKSHEKRCLLFDQAVGHDRDRTLAFMDFLLECQRVALKKRPRTKVPLLAHHSYPPASYDSTCPILFLNDNVNDPVNWRCPFTTTDSNKGFGELPVSGSAQFGWTGLQAIIARIRNLIDVDTFKITVIDLRQEPHGFVDISPGDKFNESAPLDVVPLPFMACCWMTHHDFGVAGLSDSEAMIFEKTLVTMLSRQLEVKLSWPGKRGLAPQVYTLKGVKLEEKIAEEAGVSYARFFVTDHCRPQDGSVEAFVELISRQQQRKRWYHVHCHGGRGRTTTFMCMYDMLVNASRFPDLTFVDFVERQTSIFNFNLLEFPLAGELKFRAIFARQRVEFLEAFLSYCRENPLKSGLRWTVWLNSAQNQQLQASEYTF